MHSDLSPHLHGAECNKIIAALQECHKIYTFRRFIGHCNDLDTAMIRCLRKEREGRRKVNKAKSEARHKKITENIALLSNENTK